MGKEEGGSNVFHDRRDGFLSIGGLGSPRSSRDVDSYPGGGLFATVSQMGANFGVPANSPDNGNGSGGGMPHVELVVYVPSIEGILVVGQSKEEGVLKKNKKKINGLTLKIKVENPSLRRLISGAVAGAISRTAVAPFGDDQDSSDGW